MRSTSRFFFASFFVLALSACSSRARPGVSGEQDSGPSGGGRDAGPVAPRPDTGVVTPPQDDCSDSARWIYVVDSSNKLLRFEPDAQRFTMIGTLRCPGTGSPFSMAVDRSARAWVLYNTGEVYAVSTSDASCTATGFRPNQGGLEVFGMGFSSDSPGSTAETLFIAGGDSLGVSLRPTSTFATIDTGALTVNPLGTVQGSPELTGTGDAELWGFFPTSTPPNVQRINKSSGALDSRFVIPTITSTNVQAWAFAFWGGRFYMFVQSGSDTSTRVLRLDPSTGITDVLLTDTGYRIVGAGVSTCAPTELL